MSDRPEITRRDFVRGRFLKAFGLGAKPKEQANKEQADGEEPSEQPSAGDARGRMVMRYPQSSEDVENVAGDSKQKVTSAARRTIPVLRPPGAVDEETFLAQCTRCSDCITACPHQAIIHAPERMREAAGTPMIEVDHQPCLMCEDFPCITACEPGVLRMLNPKTMGTAKVIAQTCLAHHSTVCTVCSEQCPVPEAITVTDGKPTVNEQACTGCGVCRYVCPAPQNAILLMPAFSRPSASQFPPT